MCLGVLFVIIFKNVAIECFSMNKVDYYSIVEHAAAVAPSGD